LQCKIIGGIGSYRLLVGRCFDLKKDGFIYYSYQNKKY